MVKIFIKVIESSSHGNCIALYDGTSYLILDFGTNYKNIEKFLHANNINNKNISCCLITHVHNDHVCAMKEKISENILYYSTYETKEHLKLKIDNKNVLDNIKLINDYNKWIKVPNSNWKFKAFKTIHNISGSVGYIVKNKNKKLLYFTDSEYFENRLFKKMDCYIVESNYGTSKLNTKAENKKHFNNENHMSIDDAEKFLKKYYSKKTKLFIFSHISKSGLKEKTYIKDLVAILQQKGINAKYIDPYKIMDFNDVF
ncbi:MBL fold metallo-hydrolase [Malacoplasma iowae]|uniref:MBL fold metallo-hydrolase n=1 Tax=Malacoplasma iowae TaxID=2116 RepID=UPI0038737DB8|nr:MBL fold metallo-hydrolase [Malacoplasma iowae]